MHRGFDSLEMTHKESLFSDKTYRTRASASFACEMPRKQTSGEVVARTSEALRTLVGDMTVKTQTRLRPEYILPILSRNAVVGMYHLPQKPLP